MEPEGPWYCPTCTCALPSSSITQSSTICSGVSQKRRAESKCGNEVKRVQVREELVCVCGTNVRAHKRVCPLNPKSHKGREGQTKSSPETAKDSQDVEITCVEKSVQPVIGPRPSQEWRDSAVQRLKVLSQCEIISKSEPVDVVRCAEIAPHVRDGMLDTACFVHCPKRSLGVRIIMELYV